MCPKSPQAIPRFSIFLVSLFDLNNPMVVRITDIVWNSIARDLILEIHVRYGWSEVVRVEVLLRRQMSQFDPHIGRNVCQRLFHPVSIRMALLRAIYDDPIVIGITMRV
jgi:hypothetical protein